MGIEDQTENGEHGDTIYEEALLSPETIEKIVSNGYKKTFELGKLKFSNSYHEIWVGRKDERLIVSYGIEGKEISDTIIMMSTAAATFRIKPEPEKNQYIASLSSEKNSDISTHAIKASMQYGHRDIKDF